MRRVTDGDLDVLVAHTPAGIVAVDDRCPHMSAPLSIGDLEGCVVACPLHEGRFDLCSGDVVQMPTTGGLDADGRVPPDVVAGGQGAQGRPARQEGRGAPPDPGPTPALLPRPDRRRPDRGVRPAGRAGLGSRRLADLHLGARDVLGMGLGRVRLDDLHDLVRVSVSLSSDRSLSEIAPAGSCVVRSQSIIPASTPARRGRPGSARILPVWIRVRLSNSSSSVPKPPGMMTNASAYFTNIVLRAKKYLNSIAEVDVGVEALLVGQLDVAADRQPAALAAAAVRRLHDPRAAAGDDREARLGEAPGDPPGELVLGRAGRQRAPSRRSSPPARPPRAHRTPRRTR